MNRGAVNPAVASCVRRGMGWRNTKNTSANFWDRVDRTGACWLWRGNRNSRGYGVLSWNGRLARAHRVAYELTKGPVPAAAIVMHICDTRHCVNPAHLQAGTQTVNVRDMDDKGRRTILRGARNGQAKLSDDDVRAILAAHKAGTSYGSLARKHSVSKSLISQICQRLIWRHVTEKKK